MNHLMRVTPMNRVIENFLGEFDALQNQLFSNPFFHDQLSLSKSVSRLPKINVKESSDKFLIDAAVPGLKKEDIEIMIEDNDLIIRHQRKDIVENDDRDFLLREVSFRAFERRIPFHEKIKDDGIKAKLNNGVLSIEVMKDVPSKIRKIGKIEIE